MERINQISKLLNTPEQTLQFELLVTYIHEYLSNGFNAQIVVDIQKGRISGIKRSDWSSGLTQSSYYLEKFDIE